MTTSTYRRPAGTQGFSLIELMVALVLGLIVSGAALTLFVTNRQTYTASENLGRIQESERTAFELMSRDIRESAGNACQKNLPVANVVNNPTGHWYTDFAGGVQGYDGTTVSPDVPFGTGAGQRVSGTDAIDLKSSVSDGLTIVNMPGGSSADLKLNTADNELADGDIVMACNFDHVAIFQVSQINGGGVNVVHNTGTGSPGNCSHGLGYPTVCSPTGNEYHFEDHLPSTLAKLRATRWYIGYNGRSYNGQASRSLYQSTIKNTGGSLSVANNEITEGVSNMQLKYLLSDGDDYVDASTISAADWSSDKVVAVKIAMTLEGLDKISTDNSVLQRTLEHVVTIRNRVP